jgi:DNA-binding MarR family transcriptional regulator
MICRLQRIINRQLDINLSEYGITGVQLHALIFIHISNMKGNKVCQRDLEKDMGLRPSSISSMLANLEKNGLITRSFDEGDARTKHIYLTDKGLEVCNKNKQIMDNGDRYLESCLTEEEQEVLHSVLKKLLSELDKKKI